MRFCAQQKADAFYATERFGDLSVAFGVKVGRGDVEMGGAGETDCRVSQEPVDGICDRFASASVEGEFGFARRIDWTARRSRQGGVGNVWVCHSGSVTLILSFGVAGIASLWGIAGQGGLLVIEWRWRIVIGGCGSGRARR